MIPHALIFLIMKAQWLIDCLVSHRMFRNTSWRKTASDAVSLRQDQALSTTVFLLKSYGPTGFLLQEEGATRNHKVNHLLQVVCCWYSQKKKGLFSIQMYPNMFPCSCCPGVLGWPTYLHVPCVHQGAGAVPTHLLVSMKHVMLL